MVWAALVLALVLKAKAEVWTTRGCGKFCPLTAKQVSKTRGGFRVSLYHSFLW